MTDYVAFITTAWNNCFSRCACGHQHGSLWRGVKLAWAQRQYGSIGSRR